MNHELTIRLIVADDDAFGCWMKMLLTSRLSPQDAELYMVKWKGYPESQNSWEPKRNLKCPKLMKQFHLDLDQLLRRKKRSGLPRRLRKETVTLLTQKAQLHLSLRRWETHLNHTRNHPGRIFVRNEVDLEGPPKNFTYINNYKVGSGIVLEQMAVGCECRRCWEEPVNGCCPGASLHRMAYNERGQVRLRPGAPVYECNSQCRCGPECPNRVVQKGIQFDLCIFRTGNGRGWGVRTLQRIKKNTFVMEYVGEVGPPRVPRDLTPLGGSSSHASGLSSALADHLHGRGGEAGPRVRPPGLHLPVRPGLRGGRLHGGRRPPGQRVPLRQPQRECPRSTVHV